MEKNVTLYVMYGRDQMDAVDALIKEMQEQHRIVKYRKGADGDFIQYVITFTLPFDVFLFGYKSATLWEYR